MCCRGTCKNTRIEEDIHAKQARVEVLQSELEELAAPGHTVTRRHYVRSFCELTESKQSAEESHLTRSRIAINVLQRKLKRPLSHGTTCCVATVPPK